ncbi:MAG: hydrogenase nickel incorporation protein HypB [Desulfohalobiaceae bacterium]|nr:hydrogenase nickel incorporation protein HypB [Desulfohalobiaceae bacterium]
MKIPVIRDVLESNALGAKELEALFAQAEVLVVNLMSSPGAGKTTLLERTLRDLKAEFSMGVIEGDLQTSNDAKRIAGTGAEVVQINTQGGCHLNAAMIHNALGSFDLATLDILFIENVGNLVCPAEFRLGEDFRVTLLSLPEGDDKPEKYPPMFSGSQVMILNKADLLPYLDFDLKRAREGARALNKDLEVFTLSAGTGEGLGPWYTWLREAVFSKKGTAES